MSKDWKDGLLSSGFPLEYEVSNLMLRAGYHVEGEQPFTRRVGDSATEFSVDLQAHRYVPIGDSDGNYKGQIILLCECKYRRERKSWLFMPDRNDPDFSPSWPSVLRSLWSFTSYTYDHDSLVEFRTKFPAGFKGVEVQMDSHDVFDRDIRHALNQVRYAMPDLLSRHITAALAGHVDDCKPIFVLPVIVTTAELRMLNEDVSLSHVRGAATLDDISAVVPVMDVHSPYAADFREHCGNIFGGIAGRLKSLKYSAGVRIAEYYKNQGKSYISPFTDLQSLEHGYGLDPGFFSQFLVLNLAAAASLLADVNQVVDNALRDSKQFIVASDADGDSTTTEAE
jgi:hypothetical protein